VLNNFLAFYLLLSHYYVHHGGLRHHGVFLDLLGLNASNHTPDSAWQSVHSSKVIDLNHVLSHSLFTEAGMFCRTEYTNKIQLIQRNQETNSLEKIG
jgi:hypothetical protein